MIKAPKKVRELLNSIPQEYKTRIELTEEAVMLGDTYIAENVVGKTSREDCFQPDITKPQFGFSDTASATVLLRSRFLQTEV